MMQSFFTYWSICTSSILAILLCSLFRPTDSFELKKCDPTENFHSDYVVASYKNLEPGVGCESNATSKTGQEVHIITVKPQGSEGDDADDEDEKRITVKLDIHSRRDANLRETAGVVFQENAKPIVFVLHSTQPIRWKVEIHGLNIQEKHVFILSRDSSIRFQRKRTKIMAKSRKRLPLSSDSRAIYQWTKRRQGGVTSYSEITQRNIKFYTGRDINATAQCNLKALTTSLRTFSYHEETRSITGCDADNSNYIRMPPVYIVELLEAPDPSPGIEGIDLEIVACNAMDPSHEIRGRYLHNDPPRDFTLVVKSPPGLSWKLHSKRIPGQVNIVVDANAVVDSDGVKFSVVALRTDEMNVTQRELVEWSNRYIAFVMMYVGVSKANFIKLRVPLREMASTRDRVTSPVAQFGDRQHKPYTGDLWDKEPILQQKLDGAIKTQCTSMMMEVSVPKKLLRISQADKSQISLRDPDCRASDENDEYIILRSGLSMCGTQSLALDDEVTYTNAVIIPTSPDLVSNLLQDELGSGYIEEGEMGSGSHDLSFADDEDFSYSIPVECKLSEKDMAKTTRFKPQPSTQTGSETTSKCDMSLYSSVLFIRSRTEFPLTVAKDTSLFVKANLTGKDATLLADSCWFSTSSMPQAGSAETKTIISQGCRKDDSVTWMDDQMDAPGNTNLRYTKFQVKVTDMFQGRSPLYLHCQFKMCQRGEDMDKQKCFISELERCKHRDTASVDNDQSRNDPGSNCGPLTIGPLQLTDQEVHVQPSRGTTKTKAENGQGESNHSQQQRVIIEGLDLGAVVGIAFTAFVIGILLTGALWFIHSHTGDASCCPVKRGSTNHREADASGDMTPNSSSPMTA